MLDNTPNEPPKFRRKSWIEINNDWRGAYNTNSQIIMIKWRLCDYSDTYSDEHMLVKWTISVTNTAALDAAANNNDEQIVIQNCAPFIIYISEIKYTQIDDDKDIDVVMPMYNVIKYSVNFWQVSGRDKDEADGNDAIDNFPSNSALFKFKQKTKQNR